VFFAIWWAWVNFTWFASAYDTDDVAYRLLTFVQIVGVLILAAGVPAAFVHGDFTVMTIGYVVMRVALVTQWLRAAHGDPSGRPRRAAMPRPSPSCSSVGSAACSCPHGR
jgi:low temperature requirement protein LtrA